MIDLVKYMNYGEKLKNLREYNNINRRVSQKEVADAIGIKRSSYNQFEQQYDIIPIKRLNQIANFFNVSIDYILDLTQEMQYKNNNDEINRMLAKERIKEIRKDNNLTQKELAKILQTVQPVIANYENGKNLVATPFLYDLCKRFNLSADYLLGKNNNIKYLKK